MAVRGKYSDLEKQILENFEREADERWGWTQVNPMWGMSPTVTAEMLKKFAARGS